MTKMYCFIKDKMHLARRRVTRYVKSISLLFCICTHCAELTLAGGGTLTDAALRNAPGEARGTELTQHAEIRAPARARDAEILLPGPRAAMLSLSAGSTGTCGRLAPRGTRASPRDSDRAEGLTGDSAAAEGGRQVRTGSAAGEPRTTVGPQAQPSASRTWETDGAGPGPVGYELRKKFISGARRDARLHGCC